LRRSRIGRGSDWFGCEEGIYHFVDDLFGDAVAVIGEIESQIFPGRKGDCFGAIVWAGENSLLDGDINATLRLVGHGMGGIGREVHDHLLKLHGIGQYEIVQSRIPEMNLDLLGETGAHEPKDIGDRIAEMNLGFLDGNSPAEIQHLLGKGACAGASLFHPFQVRVSRMVRGDFIADQFERAHDGAQIVVKVVRDTARHRGNGLHLLDLGELLLETLGPGFRLLSHPSNRFKGIEHLIDADGEGIQFVTLLGRQPIRECRFLPYVGDKLVNPINALQHKPAHGQGPKKACDNEDDAKRCPYEGDEVATLLLDLTRKRGFHDTDRSVRQIL
jgi:hypothetical protein